MFGNYDVMSFGMFGKYLQNCMANVSESGESQFFSFSDHFALAILPKFAKLPKLAKLCKIQISAVQIPFENCH
jgi:hypothetical protein